VKFKLEKLLEDGENKLNETKKVKIETPIGSIESDSGNHFVDIASVMLIIMCVVMFRKVMKL